MTNKISKKKKYYTKNIEKRINQFCELKETELVYHE